MRFYVDRMSSKGAKGQGWNSNRGNARIGCWQMVVASIQGFLRRVAGRGVIVGELLFGESLVGELRLKCFFGHVIIQCPTNVGY
jgi:hypothetical protein